jgi:hypothetical protein
MSRREIVVNTLLGLLLISVPALLFMLGIATLRGAGLVITHFWPQLAHSQNKALLGFFALSELMSAAAHSRKRRWRNAFLSFAALPLFLSVWFAGAHSSLGLNGDWWIAGLAFAFFIPPDSIPTRFQFFAAASTISAVVAVNTGMLGSGLTARIVSDCVIAGFFMWSVTYARELLSGLENAGPQAPLSPTSA